jgi:hypothetical protein
MKPNVSGKGESTSKPPGTEGKGKSYLPVDDVALNTRFWLSPKRDILANNRPGSKWYRLPTAEIVYNTVHNDAETFEDEGYTHHWDKEYENEGYSALMMASLFHLQRHTTDILDQHPNPDSLGRSLSRRGYSRYQRLGPINYTSV